MQEEGVWAMKTNIKFMTAYVIIGVLWCGFSGSAKANQTLTKILHQAEQGNMGTAIAMRPSLKGTARDTLDWYIYYKGAPNTSFSEVANFLNAHPKWPYQHTIQRAAEDKLRDGKLDARTVSFFDRNQPITAQAMSVYLQTNAGKAKPVLNKWWQTASLTRDEQRQIYAAYGSYISRQSHIKRMDSLLNRREFSNAQAMGDAIGGGYSQLAAARIALAKSKGDVNSVLGAVPANLRNDEGLLFDRLQWRRKKNLNQGAIEILNIAPSASKMSDPARWWKERHIIARRLMENKQYKQAYRLAAAHKQHEGFPKSQAEWVSGFLALRFNNEPYKAFEHFETLYKNVESPISRARGSYWAGRASEALNNPQIASQWYNIAAKYPETFYGQLAAEKMGRQVSLNMRASTGAQGLPNNDLANAATYLSNAGLKKEASAFLLRLKDNANSAGDYEQAANLATRLGQQDIAIKIAQTLQREKGVALGQYLYPQKVRELAKIQGVEWAFINAIIRQESRFDQNAISPAGARGLMQLMPATAKQTASRSGLSHQKAWLTSRPSHNISLGSKYLGQMTRRYNGNYAMAAAAYNAGPGRVDKWIKVMGDPRTGQVDLIDWIEQIPIYETRNYVQRVLEGVYVYRSSLKGKQPPINAPIHVATK